MDLSRRVVVATRGVWVRAEHLRHEVAKFGVIGIIAFGLDIGLFNLFRSMSDGPFHDRPLTAKIASVLISTTFAYFGNRYWTFRNRGRTSMPREYLLFFVLNGVGLLISLSCLWFSHYALGFTSLWADNISGNIIGVGLGTLFRFWSYRKWVFPPEVPADAVPAEQAPLAGTDQRSS